MRRAIQPLDPSAVQAANAAVAAHTDPLGRPLTLAPEDAALREQWTDAYEAAGGRVQAPGPTSKPVGSPAVPCPKTDPLAGKKARLKERQALIAKGRSNANSLPPEQAAKARVAADRLEESNKAVERARLAEAVYSDHGAPEGWTRLNDDPESLPPALRNAFSDPSFKKRAENSGLAAAVFKSDIDGSTVLAFRGTEGADVLKSAAARKDWGANIRQGLGFKSEQHELANELGTKLAASGPGPFEVTGHSLGGGLAVLAGAASGARTTTFNPAGIHESTFKRYGIDPAAAADNTDRYVVKGEVLNKLQDSSWTPLPKSQGKRHDLDAKVDSTSGKDGEKPHEFADGKDLSSGDRHSMQVVIDSMEAQKAADSRTLMAL